MAPVEVCCSQFETYERPPQRFEALGELVRRTYLGHLRKHACLHGLTLQGVSQLIELSFRSTIENDVLIVGFSFQVGKSELGGFCCQG